MAAPWPRCSPSSPRWRRPSVAADGSVSRSTDTAVQDQSDFPESLNLFEIPTLIVDQPNNATTLEGMSGYSTFIAVETCFFTIRSIMPRLGF
jgi:hypothetical protein